MGMGRPLQVKIDQPHTVDGRTLFNVHIIAAGTPIIIVARAPIGTATLEVNGAIVQTSDDTSRPGASQPLGYGITNLRLSNVTPSDRVVIRTTGGNAELHIVSDLELIEIVAHQQLFDGFYFAFLLLIATFHALRGARSHDRTSLWYAAWMCTICFLAATGKGFLGASDIRPILPLAILVANTNSLGFVASYLRLRREAPRLLWIIVGANICLTLIVPLLAIAFIHPGGLTVAMISPALSFLPLLAAAILRWRAGFKPAGVLAGSICAISATVVLSSILPALEIQSAWLSNWGIELATMFDMTIFAFALFVRQRYAANEHALIEADLRQAKFDATHDSLTSLLNRRGLDEWVRGCADPVATVFFIDLDGFKSINDLGGHAAGDDVLRVVSKILRHAVRECDAVARVGGDEFVLAFAGEQMPWETADIRARICAAVAALEPLGPREGLRIGASVGVGSVIDHASLDDALRAADADAYRVKFEQKALKRSSAIDC
jgi:diguanylate cyclase (GGDEF)-like protein